MAFREDLEAGEEFQDFVKQSLWKACIAIEFYSSKRFQKEEGEGPSGIEVKIDRRFRETENFYIETEHFTHGVWSPSGINRNPGMWLLAIGDSEEFFLIQKTLLQVIEKSGHCPKAETRKPGDVPTRGYLLPVEKMRKYAGKSFSRGEPTKSEEDAEILYSCRRCNRESYDLVGGLLCPDCAFAEAREVS